MNIGFVSVRKMRGEAVAKGCDLSKKTTDLSKWLRQDNVQEFMLQIATDTKVLNNKDSFRILNGPDGGSYLHPAMACLYKMWLDKSLIRDFIIRSCCAVGGGATCSSTTSRIENTGRLTSVALLSHVVT